MKPRVKASPRRAPDRRDPDVLDRRSPDPDLASSTSEIRIHAARQRLQPQQCHRWFGLGITPAATAWARRATAEAAVTGVFPALFNTERTLSRRTPSWVQLASSNW